MMSRLVRLLFRISVLFYFIFFYIYGYRVSLSSLHLYLFAIKGDKTHFQQSYRWI